VLPIDRTAEGLLVVAVANPFDRELFEQLQRLAGSRIEATMSSKKDILRAIADIYGFKKTLAKAATDFADGGPGVQNFEQLVSLTDSGSGELDASDKPIVQAVDYILRYAFDHRASDIHIEPKRDSSVVRLRIDGVLHGVHTLPSGVHAPVVSRVKMISRLDISEKRRPQDGRIKTERDGREVELRVSTLPTAFGEKVVIRIFDPETQVQDITQLGFDEDEKNRFEGWIDQPHGLILVTGPTGSGKTTTLYSALKAVAGPDLNVTTIEDPIEMVWEGFNQVQVQPKIDLTFAGALRHILRQDPDVIMVGEIRDAETATIALQAALTGHLVLTTLHTASTVETIVRLVDLGVEPWVVGNALSAVIAQRLVRVVCPHCREVARLEYDLWDGEEILAPAGSEMIRPAGCRLCLGTGYKGRAGIFEVLVVDDDLRDLVKAKAGQREYRAWLHARHVPSLRRVGFERVREGVTTIDEVMRVTTS
jgi:general secretion pathway protein E